MKNNEKNGINLIALILFITYSIVSILLFKDFLFNKETLISWTGYIFTVIAFIVTIVINKELSDENELFDVNTKSIFNKLPLFIINYVYLTLQILFSLIAIPLILVNLEVVIAIEVIILATFLIITILLLKSKEYIENVDEDTEDQISFIKGLEKEIAILTIKINDKNVIDDNSSDNDNKENNLDNLIKELEELKELTRYSNPMSNDKTREIEEDILKNLSKMKVELKNNEYVQVMNLINSMKDSLSEREIIL